MMAVISTTLHLALKTKKHNIADRMRSWRMNTGVLGMFVAPSV
jgi:heme/copper-type cytochrome/quinol oxidase subunit 3